MGRVHLDQRGPGGVGEVRRVRARRPRVLRREDRLRRRGHRGHGARLRHAPGAGPRRGAEQSSEGLLEDFPPYDDILDPVDRVLLPRADIATETLAEGLRERGWEIDDVTAYRTVRAAPPPPRSARRSRPAASTRCASPRPRRCATWSASPASRTPGRWWRASARRPRRPRREFGLRVDVQPEIAEVPALVDALAAHAARLRAEGALPRREDEGPPPARSGPAVPTRAGARTDGEHVPDRPPAPAPRDAGAARLVAETDVRPRHLILPVFVDEGSPSRAPISSMPGVVQHTRDSLRKAAAEARRPASAGSCCSACRPATRRRGSGATTPRASSTSRCAACAAEVGDATAGHGRHVPGRVHRPRALRGAGCPRRGGQRRDAGALRRDGRRAGGGGRPRRRPPAG